MKNRIAAVIIGMALMAGITGCAQELSNEYVTVSQYKDLEIPQVVSTEVTDSQVEDTIQSILSSASTQEEVTDRAAKIGDWVNIDFVGYIDGEAFENGSSENYDMELGNSGFIQATEDYKGFDEQIAGHKAGEEFDIEVQFPEDYSLDPTKAGVPAVFHITLHKVYTVTVPELTDEWVAENSEESKTVEEYRKEIKERMQKNYDDSAESEKKQAVLEALAAKTEAKKYPEGAVEDEIERANEYYAGLAGMYGMELEDFITSGLQMTEEDYEAKVKEAAQKTVLTNEAVKLVAEKEKLELSDKEYEEAIAEYAEQAGMDDVDAYKEQAGEDYLKSYVLQEEVAKYLVEHCIQVESSDSVE